MGSQAEPWGGQLVASKTEVKLNSAEKKRLALQLRLKGYSYQEIADEVGYGSKGSAHNAVSAELKAIPREAAEQAREAELSRLDQLQKAMVNQALAGDPMAVDRVLKVIESRSKLLGLYDLADNEDPAQQRTKDALAEFLQQAAAAVKPRGTES